MILAMSLLSKTSNDYSPSSSSSPYSGLFGSVAIRERARDPVSYRTYTKYSQITYNLVAVPCSLLSSILSSSPLLPPCALVSSTSVVCAFAVFFFRPLGCIVVVRVTTVVCCCSTVMGCPCTIVSHAKSISRCSRVPPSVYERIVYIVNHGMKNDHRYIYVFPHARFHQHCTKPSLCIYVYGTKTCMNV